MGAGPVQASTCDCFLAGSCLQIESVLRYRQGWHQPEGPSGRRAGRPGTRQAPTPSSATPEVMRRALFVLWQSNEGIRPYVFHEKNGHHELRARCVVEALARGAAPSPLRWPEAGCGARHMRQHAVEAADQVDPGLRGRAAQIGGGGTGDADLRRQGLWYREGTIITWGWGHHSMTFPYKTCSYSNVFCEEGTIKRRQRFAFVETGHTHMRVTASTARAVRVLWRSLGGIAIVSTWLEPWRYVQRARSDGGRGLASGEYRRTKRG